MRRLVVSAPAEADLEEIAATEEARNPFRRQRFLDDFHATALRIAETALSYQVVHRDVRRALLKQHPYAVFYRVLADDVLVVGVFHVRRSPRIIRRRR